MEADHAHSDPELMRSFAAYDQQATINNIQLGCWIGMALMPAGVILDAMVYPDYVIPFLELRLLSSALIGLFLLFVRSEAGRKLYRELGVTLAMFPAFFIACMIYAVDGWESRYYAGINLVLLVVGYILHWTLRESVIAFSLVVGMYISACLLNSYGKPVHMSKQIGYIGNNLYFIGLTGIIVVWGSYHHSKRRFKEFVLRYQLDKSRNELENTNQKLKELDEVKSRFFANISHELRTPLTLLLAPLEALIHKERKSNPSPNKELLGTMQANGMRLLKLINDLLDLVRLDSGTMKVKKEPVDLDAFVAGLIIAVQGVADDKRLQVRGRVYEDVGLVMVDRDKVEKIILNLLFNAVKFTPAGGRIDLTAEKRGEHLVLQIKDTGMGISKENMANAFDRFWQADSSSQRKFQGAGIGLALVKELVEVQGGSVKLQSEVQKGTTFTIKLPYERAEKVLPDHSQTDVSLPVASPSDQEEWLTSLYRRAEMFPSVVSVQESLRPVEVFSRNGKPSILIADDEPDMLRFLKSQLSDYYHVIEAVDGNQATEKAAQFLPDIVLLDMMMPEKDGLQVCRELRAKTSTKRIPILLLTARADEETKLTALASGASDFLPKPFSTTEVHVRIKNLIDSHEYQRKLTRQNQILEATLQQLKETETQLVQSEKLASLGRMSAGIIHEINNPLNFAKTAIHMLKQQGQELPETEQEEFGDTLKDIEEGIDRVRIIVSDLRSFTHPNTENFEIVYVRHIVSAALRFSSHEWKQKVLIEQDFDENQTILGNRHQLVQVILNMLQNALDSMKSKDFGESEPRILIKGVNKENMFQLIIRDNGPGIATENLGKIFDPFFTTKDVGEGMGLGLSICYKIMEAHEGRIDVRSEPGEFCEFILEFPLKHEKQLAS
jgi:signal transduction histidine kinase